jgi:hypothetical protein
VLPLQHLLKNTSGTSWIRVNSQTDHLSHTVANRYPQYWNDYSTFPQLGQAYPNVHDNSQLPHLSINLQLYTAPEQSSRRYVSPSVSL